MRIGIITFHASHNYGSMLQAWALQTYLEQLGHDVEIVNYRSRIQRIIYHKPISFNRRDVALASLKRFLLFPQSIRPLHKKWYLFENFLVDELKITEEFHTIDDLATLNDRYDLLVCGSDQIWNTHAPDSGEAYYGNWFTGDKISYAASLGQKPEYCSISFLKQQVKGFKAIACREERSLDFLIDNGIVNEGHVVCDPTLLLEARDYDSLVSDEPLIKGDYVFFYTPVGMPHAYFKIASDIGKELGCQVITEKAYYPKDIKQYGNISTYIPTGPKEFLNLIRYAKCVCGGSFHLQVFSILFQKDFYCINGDKDSRTNHLLNLLGLQDRIISLNHPELRAPLHISFMDDNGLTLQQFRKESVEYLNQYLHE